MKQIIRCLEKQMVVKSIDTQIRRLWNKNSKVLRKYLIQLKIFKNLI